MGTGSAVESLPLPEEYTQDLAKAGKPTGMPKFSDSAKTGFEAALQRQYGQPKDDAGNGGKGQVSFETAAFARASMGRVILR